jgi:hypothetical protein
MKNGTCPKCSSTNVYFDKNALGKIPVRAEKLGDWKKAR